MTERVSKRTREIQCNSQIKYPRTERADEYFFNFVELTLLFAVKMKPQGETRGACDTRGATATSAGAGVNPPSKVQV